MPVTNEGRFSARYSQYEPFLSPTGVSVTPYTDAPPVTPHTSVYSASALGAAGAGAVAAAGAVGAAAAASHTYPPAAGSTLSSSTTGVGRTLSVVNDTGDISGIAAAGLTPAQRKAAEAASEKKDGPDADAPVQYHADSEIGRAHV